MARELLNDELVMLYFQPMPGISKANGELVVRGMQEDIREGDRFLSVGLDGTVMEMKALPGDPRTGYHPLAIRLPLKYQSPMVRVTCPDCHFTYEHRHIFAEGTK